MEINVFSLVPSSNLVNVTFLQLAIAIAIVVVTVTRAVHPEVADSSKHME